MRGKRGKGGITHRTQGLIFLPKVDGAFRLGFTAAAAAVVLPAPAVEAAAAGAAAAGAAVAAGAAAAAAGSGAAAAGAAAAAVAGFFLANTLGFLALLSDIDLERATRDQMSREERCGWTK
jgi:hypothetical protein